MGKKKRVRKTLNNNNIIDQMGLIHLQVIFLISNKSKNTVYEFKTKMVRYCK